MQYFVQDSENNRKVYRSKLIDNPSLLSILSNKTALRLIKELSVIPACAMDLARRLKLHEQKVYYNLRQLEKAGIIKLFKTEERTGGTAKIYALASPVVSFKIVEDILLTSNLKITPENVNFLRPFILNGNLNAQIILGDSYSHGKYDTAATEGPHVFDFAILLGSCLSNMNFPHYKLDTDATEKDLKENLILFGNVKTNTIIEKLNSDLPIYFDPKTGNIISKYSNKTYDDPRIGVILKIDNPLNKKKKILIFGGIRTRGMHAAVVALTKHLDEVIKNLKEDGIIARVVEGYDKDGDKIIDSIKFLE